jgi:pyruvate kinase
VSNRKGVSLPVTVLPLAALASKDIADLEAALDAGVDWIALSFIQRPEDVAEAKKLTRGRAAVMAKIEKPQAVARLAAAHLRANVAQRGGRVRKAARESIATEKGRSAR